MKNFIEDSAEQIMLNSMANVFIREKLDPVGKEDSDIDNDGDSDKSDSYLRKRRQAVGAAIAAEKAKRVRKEEVEATLRQKVGDLTEKKLYPAEKATFSDEKDIPIEEKPVKNVVKINPDIQEGLKQARANVGAGKCWDGYVAKGTKKKGGKEVPNCVKEEEISEGKKKGLWDNIHAKRKRGERPARPGEKDYPKTLNVEETLQEKAVSRKQQRFMGMVRAAQKGEGAASPEVAKVAASMKKKDVKDFASTKHAKLPEKKSLKEEIAAIAEGSRRPRDPEVEAKGKKVGEYERADKYEGITSKFRKEHPGSREKKKVRGAKETPSETQSRRINRSNERKVKYGFTSKEKKEAEIMSKHTSPRD